MQTNTIALIVAAFIFVFLLIDASVYHSISTMIIIVTNNIIKSAFHKRAVKPLHNITLWKHAYEPIKDDRWDAAIHAYMNQYRLMTRKVLICKVASGSGMCNRMNHLVSCMLLAMTLQRAVVFKWDMHPTNYNIYSDESVGIDSFDDIFKLNRNLSNLMNARVICKNKKKIDLHTQDMYAALSKVPPRLIFPRLYQCIEIDETWDYWGHLLLQNKNVHFPNADTAFSSIAKVLFQPKYAPYYFDGDKNVECQWLIQRRTKWPRPSNTLDKMLQCARDHGMNNQSNMWILSDDENDPVELNPLPYCRGSPYCDSDVLHVMYRMAACKNVVLTHHSTFGECIARLGNIHSVWVSGSRESHALNYELATIASHDAAFCA